MNKKFKLTTNYKPAGDQPSAIKKLIQGLEKGYDKQVLLGVTGSGKTFTMANVILAENKPTLIISHNKTLAAQLYNEFKEFFPKNRVEYFVSYYDYYQPESYMPKTDTYIEKDTSINPKIEQMRLSATQSLLTRNDVIIVASVSCIYGLGNPENYDTLAFELRKGQKISRKKILRNLIDQQYQRNEVELTPGSFRVKGDVIDVIPGYSDDIFRIELFGDVVERLSFLDPYDFETKEKLDYYYLFPARHFVTDEATRKEAIITIKEELKEELPKITDPLIKHRLKTRVSHDLEMIEQIGHCKGIENYSRHFDKRKKDEPPYCLMDYFPNDFLLVIDESHQTLPQIRAMYKGDRTRKESLVNYGFRLPSALDNRPLKFEEYQKYENKTIYVSATPAEYEFDKSKQVVEQIIRPTGLVDPKIITKPKKGQMSDLIGEIERTVKKNYRTLVTTLTKRMAEELTEYLSEKSIKVRYLHSEIDTLERTELIRQLRLGEFDVLVGINLLREGLDIPEVALVAILDADKEGFLRDARSIIQTAGRASRNSESKVILYMDRETDSIKKAIQETMRRRKKQQEHNKKYNIKPQTIIKKIKETPVTEIRDVKNVAKNDIPKLLLDLQERMRKEADNLNFEAAILMRNKVEKLKKRLEK